LDRKLGGPQGRSGRCGEGEENHNIPSRGSRCSGRNSKELTADNKSDASLFEPTSSVQCYRKKASLPAIGHGQAKDSATEMSAYLCPSRMKIL
jgi:hypothetical protein